MKYRMPVIKRKDRATQIAAAGLLLIGILSYSIHFTATYFPPLQQIDLGWGCLAIMIVMYKTKKSQQQPYRLIFLVLGVYLALRYMMWRTFDTLLYTGPLDFVGMTLVYVAEVYGLAIYFMGMFVNVWPLVSRPVPLPPEPDKLPSVDILIPTYNESDEIVRITATAAANLDYPKSRLKVYIIDDGSTHAKRSHPENGMSAWERHYRLRQMAADLGIEYITRETNQQAKAGNINHALQYTHGDLVLVLDCDHVPTSDFLQRTVGHFMTDPKLFLVQTPHFFINPTPVEKNLEGVATPSGENDMFYRKIHPALNFWNASYFCGSAALLRRKYLMEVGGICGTTITEDAETAFQLHSRGYNSIYINRPMVCGLSPESYDDYVIQRSRWAQGMVQLLLLNNPLKTKGLSIPQKIAYFNSSFFWFFGLSRFIYFIAPSMYLILGLNIYHASWLQILVFTLPYLVSTHMVMDYFYAGSRQPFFSEIYESVQSLFLIPAVLSVMVNPWKPSFKVTPKGFTNDKNYLSPLAAPFFLVIAINITAVILAIVKFISTPILRDVIAVTAIWCVYNLYLSVVSLGAFWERKQVRKFHRINTSGRISAHFPRMGSSHEGRVRDVSISGIGFELDVSFLPREQDHVMLEVQDSYGATYHFEAKLQRVFKRNGRYFCGSEFIPNMVSYADIVSYVFGDSQRWQDDWDKKSAARGTAKMLWYFLKTGVQGFVGSAYPLLKATLVRLWKLAKTLTLTPFLWEKTLAAASWCVYFLYLMLAALIQLLDNKKARKLQRIAASGDATIYFPRINSTVVGDLMDVSLTGMGFLADLPFKIRAQEHATIWTVKDGIQYRFPCVIQRTLQRGDKVLFGTEFIVDTASYSKIVRYVYGDNVQMLHYVSNQALDLIEQGGDAIAYRLTVAAKTIGMALAFIFLNQDAGPLKQKLDAWIKQSGLIGALTRTLFPATKVAGLALSLAFMNQDKLVRKKQFEALLRLISIHDDPAHNRRMPGRKRGRLRLIHAFIERRNPFRRKLKELMISYRKLGS